MTYSVISSLSRGTTTAVSQLGNIAVSIPEIELKKWASSEQVGVYADVALGDDQRLSVAVEKDFACLDQSDADNEDTLPKPESGRRLLKDHRAARNVFSLALISSLRLPLSKDAQVYRPRMHFAHDRSSQPSLNVRQTPQTFNLQSKRIHSIRRFG
jgi:hypothetical protein